MALYSELQVFKATYDLLLLIFRTTPNVKREYRYCLLESIKKDTTELCIEIYRANQAVNKDVYLNRATEIVMQIRLKCRILKDLEQISVKLFTQLFSTLDSISKQLSLWRKYQSKKTEEISIN